MPLSQQDAARVMYAAAQWAKASAWSYTRDPNEMDRRRQAEKAAEQAFADLIATLTERE
jgi:hypothetical protein